MTSRMVCRSYAAGIVVIGKRRIKGNVLSDLMEAARTDLSRVSISVQVNKNTINHDQGTHNRNQLVQHLRRNQSGQWVVIDRRMG